MAKSRQKNFDKMEIIELPQDKIKARILFKQARASGKLFLKLKTWLLDTMNLYQSL